jgi:hypothetical protein
MPDSPLSARAQPAIDARFHNLCANGILPRSATGPAIDPVDIARATVFLNRCRRTKRPNIHSFDLRRQIGVSLGAVIAAGVALGFEVRGWYGIMEFYPHALMGVNRRDVRRQARAAA